MKKIIVLGCNFDQIPYLKILKKDSYFIIGFDKNNNCPGKKFCDKFYSISYVNHEKIIAKLKKEKINNKTLLFSAASQNSIITLSKIAKRFKIEFTSEKKLKICLDNNKLTNSFNRFNINTPKSKKIYKKDQYLKILINLNINKNYYLKSDFSKNPKHVYKINKKSNKKLKINWNKDEFLVKNYLLQEEFIGKNLRLNFYGNRYNIYDFVSHKKINAYKYILKKFNLIKKLKKYIKFYDLTRFIVKFDIIISAASYVVLDIGLDPPYRMNKYCLKNKINFPKHYLNHNLRNILTYPISLDK